MSSGAGGGGSGASAANREPIWDWDGPQLNEWARGIRSLYREQTPESSAEVQAEHQIVDQLMKHLDDALSATYTEAVRSSDSDTASGSPGGPPAKKRAKKDRLLGFKLYDPYRLWIHIKEFETIEDSVMLSEALPTTPGAKLAELGIPGILNGFAHMPGGLVDKQIKPLDPKVTEIQTPAGPVKLIKLRMWAMALHESVKSRLEKDVLDTTPQRIAHMLCPDLTPTEFKAVRKRIYDTVVLGKGLKVEDTAEEIPVASHTQSVHDIEKFKKCKVCGNNDQSSFILDRKNGDVICSSCGTVVAESVMHEGSQFRKFEGEVDRNHHGDAANPLLSTSYNMSTTLGGVQVNSGAGMGGFGSNQNKRGLETILRNAHAFTELNVSSFGNGKDSQGRTRVGYKDKQKRTVFIQMNHVGDALNLHEAVVQRAKEIFAGFRDDRELLHQLKPVIAACLCEAFDQLAQDGRKILQQQETGTVEADEIAAKEEAAQKAEKAKKAAINKAIAMNGRAMKRADLHKASMAGKHGLFLDLSEVGERTMKLEHAGAKPAPAATSPASKFEMKSAATWDLEDCRSWLLEASRAIAQAWVDERDSQGDANEGNGGRAKPAGAAKKNYPRGSRDELEGKLVEDSITLCEFLESEMIKDGKGGPATKRVKTPRVTDMSKLGISWQHAHERGSGGKGGVGNSGNMKKRAAASMASSKRAGQILILQAAKKLGEILKDPLAGEYFHKELRALIARQKARKDRALRDEATRQRLTQMKRKPWLQAKVQGGN